MFKLKFMEIVKILKENVLVIIAILMVIIVLFNLKSNFTSNKFTTYSEDNCYKNLRVYPSGKIPGSYLGLSRQEIDNLLPEFILNKS